MSKPIPPCPVCGTEFDNVFEATDHLLEDGEEAFNPRFVLPNGYAIYLGSFLRFIYDNADDVEKIKSHAQSTYSALWVAENNPNEMRDMIEDIIIDQHMDSIDEELKELLDEQDGE